MTPTPKNLNESNEELAGLSDGEIRELVARLPNLISPEFPDEVKDMGRAELQRRLLIQSDWIGAYSRSLDGIKEIANMGGGGMDKLRMPDNIRAIVLKLTTAVSPLREEIEALKKELDSLTQPETSELFYRQLVAPLRKEIARLNQEVEAQRKTETVNQMDLHKLATKVMSSVVDELKLEHVRIADLKEGQAHIEAALHMASNRQQLLAAQSKIAELEQLLSGKNGEGLKWCGCATPIPVVSSPIDTIETCQKCGKSIKGSDL